MIELHRQPEDPLGNEIERKLNDLVVSFRTHIHNTQTADGEPLPHIRETNRIVSGKEALAGWLIELEADLVWQRSISGDGCYIDPKSGDVC